MAIWNGLTETGAVVPIQVDDQGRVVVSGGGGLQSQVYGTAKALGLFNADGSTVFAMGCSAANVANGNYRVTLDTPFPDTNYIVVATCAGNASRFCFTGERLTDSVVIATVNANGSPSSTSISVAFFDARPTDVTPLILPMSALNDIERLKAAVGLDDDSPVS